MKQVDVLVVGLGPAGSSAAYMAARDGLSVLAIDKNQEVGVPVQCAEFIPLPMGKYAKRDGVLEQRVIGMKSFLPSGEHKQSEFPGLMINRDQFDQSLAQNARDAGATLWLGTRLVSLDKATNTAIVLKDDVEQSIEYKVLVAADGPHSQVASQCGLEALDIVQTRQYTVPLLKTPYDDTDIWVTDDFPGGYGWLFPKGDTANVGLGLDKSRYDGGMKEPLDKLHKHLVDQGIVGEEISYRTGGAIPVGGLRAELSLGNIVFVGDAAGFTHPITGAGISAAVITGERAGEAVIDYIEGDEDAFDDYEEDMRDQFDPTLTRAVARRAHLHNYWKTEAAQLDSNMRQGWIAFDEYFDDGLFT